MTKRLFVSFILVVIILINGSCIATSSYDDKVLEIRKQYQEVEKQIKDNELIETRMNLIANEGANIELPVDIVPIYKLYWSSETNNLVKVNIYIGRGSVYFDKEYLFRSKGEVAFIYEKTTNTQNKKVLEEYRYYFNNNQLFRYSDGKNIVDKNFSSKILEISKTKIKNAELLKDIFEKVWLVSK